MVIAIHSGSGEVYEGEDAFIMHRIILPNGAAAVTGSFSNETHTVDIYDITDPVNANNAVMSDTQVDAQGGDWFFDALQTDGYWTADSTGYNFRYHFKYGTGTTTGAKEAILKGGHDYRFEFSATTTGTDYGIIRWVTVLHVRPLSKV